MVAATMTDSEPDLSVLRAACLRAIDWLRGHSLESSIDVIVGHVKRNYGGDHTLLATHEALSQLCVAGELERYRNERGGTEYRRIHR